MTRTEEFRRSLRAILKGRDPIFLRGIDWYCAQLNCLPAVSAQRDSDEQLRRVGR